MKIEIENRDAAGSPTNAPASRRKTWLAMPATLAAMIAIFSLGLAAPAATAAEPNMDAVYTLSVNGQVRTLTEGETVVYGMQRINSHATPGQVSPNVVYASGAGTLTVTASGGVYHYSIAMSIPATNFSGYFHITDLTSGLSGGYVAEFSFSGSIPTSKLHGHTYSGTLSGFAYFLGVAVATTVPNNTLYTY